MAPSNSQVTSGLNSRIFQLLSRVEYRKAVSSEEREEVFRLRHDAYVREGAIDRRDDGLFRDEVDDACNTSIYAVYIDGNLVSSIRLSVATPSDPDIPTAHVFPELIGPEISRRLTIVDPTRFVADHVGSRKFPELPYITLRIPWLAMDFFDADLMLAAVRPEHEAFYRRLWGNRTLCGARTYPGLLKPVSLTVLDYAAARDTVCRRYPFFNSTEVERESIFAGAQPAGIGWSERSLALRQDRFVGHGARQSQLSVCGS